MGEAERQTNFKSTFNKKSKEQKSKGLLKVPQKRGWSSCWNCCCQTWPPRGYSRLLQHKNRKTHLYTQLFNNILFTEQTVLYLVTHLHPYTCREFEYRHTKKNRL